MNASEINEFATRLAGAFEADRPPPRLTAEFADADLALAYRVQQALVERLSQRRPVVGFKAGLTAPAAQAAQGIDTPVSGVLLQADFEPRARAFGPLAIGAMRLETEFAYRVSKPIDAPLKIADLPGYIDSCHAAIEVVQDRLVGSGGGAIDLVAYDVNARGFLLGDEVPLQREKINLSEVTLEYDGRELHREIGGSVQGDQFVALCWLVNRIVERGYRIEAGNILLTGAIGGIHPGDPGGYRARHGDFGRLDFEVVGG